MKTERKYHRFDDRKWFEALSDDGCVLVRSISTKSDWSEQTLGCYLRNKLGENIEIHEINSQPWFVHDVSLDVRPEGTNGYGENKLHIDYVPHSNPPKYIALACVRPDPLGGGCSVISSFEKALVELTYEQRELLKKPVFRYYTDETGALYGDNISPFPVISHDFIRFTSRALYDKKFFLTTVENYHDKNIEELESAYLALSNSLSRNSEEVMLHCGDVMLFDQSKYAHGRASLGANQKTIEVNNRRLLIQFYGSDK